MKKLIIFLFLILGMAIQTNAWAGPPPHDYTQNIRYPEKDFSNLTAEEHLALADQFEQKVAAQDKEIAFHEAMMQKYEYKTDFHPKRGLTVQKMKTHCDAIIRSLKKIKENYKEMAKLHREMAKEAND